jgi:hypothetical protein
MVFVCANLGCPYRGAKLAQMQAHLRSQTALQTHTEDEKRRSLQPATVADNNWHMKMIHDDKGAVVMTRDVDDYVNATYMCREFGQSWSVYVEDPDTQLFLGELCSAMQMSESDLISTQDGVSWVPPVLAVHLAGFCCPRQQIRMILLLGNGLCTRKSVSKMCDEASLLAASKEAAARVASEEETIKAEIQASHMEAMQRGQAQLDALWREKEAALAWGRTIEAELRVTAAMNNRLVSQLAVKMEPLTNPTTPNIS